ncbi:uncharacterized protein TNCV_675751 [Trichonephila clavipes]|nr:uncharacterized protein TNCV_675751 [Trichonephila clavipes]
MYGKYSRYRTPNYYGILITNDSSRLTVYVPILLNKTFITALWKTGAEKSFISEEVYRKYFSYRPRQKTKDRIVPPQGAPCCPLDQQGLTHVLYHEIDTGDKGTVVSRPYRYDRVKQGIIDNHIDKMLQEDTIRPILSTYASPVVSTRKNNGLPPVDIDSRLIIANLMQ